MKSIIHKINFLNFMVNIENTKNECFCCINGNLELYTFIIDIDIAQITSSYTKIVQKR